MQSPRGVESLAQAGGLSAPTADSTPLGADDLRHTFGQRLRDAGISEEDGALLLGHAIEGMPQHYATATVARLVDVANRVQHTIDRATLLRVVNG